MDGRQDGYGSRIESLIRSLSAGGLAGAVAKTAVAPLDRVKILFQTHEEQYARFTGSWQGVLGALRHIVRTQGIVGLFRGYSSTFIRAVPRAAIEYTVYDGVRLLLMPSKSQETAARRMLAGSIAGISVLPFAYPFELIRVRMAIQTKSSSGQPGLRTVFRTIYSEQPSASVLTRLLQFYRGFPVTLLGTVPYRGGVFLLWELLNDWARDHLPPSFRAAHPSKLHLAIGATAGTIAQVATFPLELVRRVQQASGEIHTAGGPSVSNTVRSVWRRNGWKGFYTGLGVSLLMQVPAHSISFAVWQASKQLLQI